MSEARPANAPSLAPYASHMACASRAASHAWRKATSLRRELIEPDAHEEERLSKRAAHGDSAMSSGLRHLLHRGLSRGWRSLVAHQAESNALRKRTASSLAHVIHHELSAGWHSWRGLVEERAAALSLLQSAGSRMANRRLATAWGSWVDLLVEKVRMMEPMRKGLSRMMNRSMALALGCWTDFYEHQRALRAGLRHMLH